jgi:hypothetical protein
VSLSVVDRIADHVISDEDKLKGWRASAREAVRKVAKDDDVPLPEKIELTQRMRERYFGSFRRALRTMQQISLKLFASPRVAEALELFHGDAYFLVHENSIINIVLEDEVLKHTGIQVTSM